LAFNTLYKEYSGRLYRFAFGYLKSEEEAEELVQEVFTIIWEKRADLKEELSFKSFLFTIFLQFYFSCCLFPNPITTFSDFRLQNCSFE